MRNLNFSKPKARERFDAYSAKTRNSYSKISSKLNMSASYLSSVLKDGRGRPSDNMVYAMAKLLKVDVSELCDEPQEELSVDENATMVEDDDELVIVLKGSTLRALRDPLKRLLEEAISLLSK